MRFIVVLDLLHAYMGLAGLSIAGHADLGQLHAPLNMSMRAYEWMKEHCVFWKQ